MQDGSHQKQMQIWLSFWNPMTKDVQSAEEEFLPMRFRSLLTLLELLADQSKAKLN